MMDHNSVYLSGWCKKAGINEGKFGPSGWALISIPRIDSDGLDIPNHNTFVRFQLGADQADKTAKNKERFSKIEEGGFLTLWDVSVISYVKYGETRATRELRTSINKSMITKDAGVTVNLAAFVGKVIQQPHEEWCELYTTHRPGKNAKPGDPWPHYSVKVHLPGGRIKVKVGHQYFVAGKVSARTPSGQDDLIVVANLANGV